MMPRYLNSPMETYQLAEHPLDGQIHPFGHQCRHCEPHVPSVPARLTANDMGKLAVAGAAFGTIVAFAIDAHGAIAALAACIGVSW